jgi:chromosome segregation ATPase
MDRLQAAVQNDPNANRDQAFRYLREVQNATLRHGVLQNELDDTQRTVSGLNTRVDSAETVLGHINAEASKANARLAELHREVAFLKSQASEQEAKKAAVVAEAVAVKERADLIQTTMESLAKDREKSVLLLRNFAPRFDVALVLAQPDTPQHGRRNPRTPAA